MLRLLLAVISPLGLIGSVQAQSYNGGLMGNGGPRYYGDAFVNTGTFTNAGSSAFISYAGTLTNRGAYTSSAGATDQLVGPAGAAGAQEIAGTTAPGFYNLTVANGAASVLSISNPAGIDVANTLTLSNGKTTTTNAVAGAIRLAAAAPAVAGTLGATAGYVDGYLSKAGTTSFTYPLGATNANTTSGAQPNTSSSTVNGSTIYSAITLAQPGGTTLRYVAAPPSQGAVATQAAPLQLATVSTREYYPMAAGTTPANTSVTLPYGNFGPAGYVGDPTKLTIAGFDGTSWMNLGTASNTVDTGAQTVTVSLNQALSGFTMLALASTSAVNPLPVELLAFTATKQSTAGLLTWSTASERNSAYFELQASRDGNGGWQVLTTVVAAGNSGQSHSYAFVDQNLARYGASLIYYRLRQVDLDGTAVYSPVRTLAPDALWSLSAYPNPFSTTLTATLTTPEAGPATLVLYDLMGRVVLRQQVAATAGSQLIDLQPIADIATGQYVLRVQQGSHSGSLHLHKD